MESVYYRHLNETMKLDRDRIDDHERRLRVVEQDKLETERRFDTFSRIIEQHERDIEEVKQNNVKFENTMLKEFRETRESNRENMKWLQGMIERQQGEEVAAATREHEAKRTKLQVFRDITLALFGGIGALWGGLVAYQEIILQFFK